MPTEAAEGATPVVLVGGSSSRFGRDKLVEPMDDEQASVLVDHAISALRAVFGPCVAVVGKCDPRVVARADGAVTDRYPGIGPIGGILSALRSCGGPVFVLPGDLRIIAPEVVASVLGFAGANPRAGAVLADTGLVQWCVGLYRPSLMEHLHAAIRRGDYALHRAVPKDRLCTVEVSHDALRDVDFPEDLRA